LIETGKIGIAKVAMRNREYLSAVKPDGLFLMLDLMHFAQEVLEPEGLRDVSATDLSAKEIEMAKTLINSLSAEWEPDKYVDQYQAALRELIEAKIQHRPKGQTTKVPQSTGPVIDLLSVLKESIEKNPDKRKSANPAAGGRASRSTRTLVKQKRKSGARGDKLISASNNPRRSFQLNTPPMNDFDSPRPAPARAHVVQSCDRLADFEATLLPSPRKSPGGSQDLLSRSERESSRPRKARLLFLELS
jgi:hypothetical protein